MFLTPAIRTIASRLGVLAILLSACRLGQAQAALLMEEPYGFFGALNPTGHDAIYFARICAETPIKLRRCAADEPGSVFTRYQGIAGYDWVAMPLIAYLYSVEDPSAVPARADRKTVTRLREQYHEAHLLSLGKDLPEGGTFKRGWNQLVGVSYERRMYAFRFATTEEQDDALIVKMNSGTNRSRYSLFFWNCADFSSAILNFYFPRVFRRSPFPDAGITTPKQVTYELVRFARQHPETQLSVLAIPQVPGYRRRSRPNKSITQSLIVRGYVIPLAIFCPACAGGLLADWLVWGRYPLHIEQQQTLTPQAMTPLTSPAEMVSQSPQTNIRPAN
ncbi:MAG: hypothetical protein ABR905_07860 [Terracidiphilus sp.]